MRPSVYIHMETKLVWVRKKMLTVLSGGGFFFF